MQRREGRSSAARAAGRQGAMCGGGPVEEAGPDLGGPGLNGGRWSPACRRQQATWRFVFLAVGGIGTQGSQAWAHGDNEKAVTRVQSSEGRVP